MYLAISTPRPAEDAIIRKVPQMVKVCSATHIEQLINKAVPGITLKHLANPPSVIPG